MSPPADLAEHVDMAEPLRRVCLCVDDFGLHGAINAAVLRLVELRRVGATGAMVDGSAWPEGARALRGIAPQRLDVGLHLDLTEAQTGRDKPSLRRLLWRAYTGRIPPASVRAEIRRQLDAFEQGLQRPPAFVDGHQHVHQLPVVRTELVAELTRRYDPAELPWLRDTRPGTWRGAGLANAVKARVIEQLGSGALRSLARAHGLTMNRRLAGVYGFDADALQYQDLLRAWLAQAHDGDLLMCHPATAPIPGDPIATARCSEYQVLSSDWFGSLVEQAGVGLGPLSLRLA